MPLRFLTLDDDYELLEIYEYFLTDAFFDVIIKKALNNEEAWLILKDFTPDLIITDLWHSPGGNGLDFLRELRQDTTKSFIPVIGVSGYGYSVLLKKKKEFNAVLKKPITRRILIDCIKEFLPQTDEKEATVG